MFMKTHREAGCNWVHVIACGAWKGAWAVIRTLYLWRYGRRGGIRPPRYSTRGDTRWRRWRRFWWRVEDSIYYATGIPSEWYAWRRGERSPFRR